MMTISRRAFLRTIARVAGMAGLGGIVWASASKSASGRTVRLPCERCPALPSCSLPDSLSTRDALGPGNLAKVGANLRKVDCPARRRAQGAVEP